MPCKQEIFDAFYKYYVGLIDEESGAAGWLAELREKMIREQFEFFYDFFKEYMYTCPEGSK